MKTQTYGFFRRMIKRAFNTVGLDVVHKETISTASVRKGSERTWRERLQLAKTLGFAPRTILDGGAFRGLWSKEVAGLFPGAQIILVEPNPFVQDLIVSNISGIQPSPILLNLALGDVKKKSTFNIWGHVDADQGASLLGHVIGQASQVVEVDVDTLDNIAQRLSLIPDLLKLDLQGGELAALKGAAGVLQHAEFAIIEFGCLDAYINRTTPRELMDIMYNNNYCLYDIVNCSDRPYDGALTGGDFFFVKRSSILRQYKGWS